jgi:RNA polymerase sigma-32 factor
MARTNRASDVTEALWRAAKNAPMLSAEHEARLAREARAGSQRAFNDLLNAHLRLVLTFARKFSSYGAALQDLVSEGLLGLVEAARRFDPDRGARLSTYASWWIHAYMRRYTIMNRRMVRAPTSRHGSRLMAHLRSTQRELTQLTGAAPDAHAIAAALGVGVRDVEEMESALSGRDVAYGPEAEAHSWDAPVEQSSPEQLVADAEEQRVVNDVIAKTMAEFRDRDRAIVTRRYFDEEPSTLAALGNDLGLSRERVRQLNEQACGRLRAALQESGAGATS